jgi:hypothetical protein
MSNQPQQWQYVLVTISNAGKTTVLQPNGASGVIPEQPMIVTINKFGREGWELIQENVAPDSSGVTLIMKRPAPPETEGPDIDDGVR